MRRISIVILMLSFLIAGLHADPASAATYYVDSGAGTDASDGLSPATAWRTLARVNTQALAPGDVIRFKRSQTWYEATDLKPESGTQALPIVFDAYGTGEAPIISGAIHSGLEGLTWTPSSAQPDTYYLSQGGADPGIVDRASPFTVWRLFRASDDAEFFEGSLGSLNDAEWAYGDVDTLGFTTIYLRDDAGTPADVLIPQARIPFRLTNSWIEIRNLVVDKAAETGVRMTGQQLGLTVKNTTVRDSGGPGLKYGGVDVDLIDIHVTLEDSKFLNNNKVGATVTGFYHDFLSEGIFPTVNTGVLIKGCEFAFNQDDGLKLFYINDSRVTENVFHENGAVAVAGRGGSGVVFDGSSADANGNGESEIGVGCNNNEVDRNIAYGNGNSGIIFEFFGTGNDIHHNLIYDNGYVEFTGGIAVNHTSFENTIRYNVIYDHRTGFLIASLFEGDGEQEASGNIVVHNTTIRDLTGGNHVYVVQGKDTIIKNNIMVNQTSMGGVVGQGRNEQIANGPPPPGDQEFDYNVWVLRNAMRWANSFWGLASYQANTIHADNTIRTTVPIPFASPGMPDFAYIPGTTPPVNLVGATDLPASIYADGDFLGRPVNTAAPTRGAFETGDACSTSPECGDGEFCNGDEICSGIGVCYPGPLPCGTQLCRESDDTCVDCLDGSVCDDGVFCNGTEQCDAAGTCQPGSLPCGAQLCRESDDACVDCLSDSACSDDVFCNGIEQCDAAGTCQLGPDPCQPGETCDEIADECQGSQCGTDPDCDDQNPCTDDICNAGTCEYTNNTLACDDSDACTTTDVCSDGVCTGTLVDCDDGNACTDDTCNAGVCENTNNTLACDDSDACTTADVCSDGVCTGTLVDCDDGNACTDDTCNAGVCENTNNTLACDDSNACTTADVCSDGVCSGTLVDCDDGNACTDDTCNAGVCENTNNTLPCDDSNACTTADVCSDGVCTGTLVDCDDGNACTDDTCNAGVCENTNNTLPCDDSNACTTTDVCSDGVCTGTLVDCDDGVFCNGIEQCDAAGTCQPGPDPCQPGDNCDEIADECEGSQCGTGPDCDDQNPCTDDICNAGVCENTNNTLDCDDSNACTTADVCAGGSCGGVPLDCNDNSSCTFDFCGAGGCFHTPSGDCSLSGSVTYYRDSALGEEPSTKPVPDVEIDIDSDDIADTTTGPGGDYAVVAGGTAVVTPMGKLQLEPHPLVNAPVSSLDASLVAQDAIGLIALSDNQIIAGDVSGNGENSSYDASLIAQFAVSLFDHFPVAVSTDSDWAFLRCDNYDSESINDCDAPSYSHDPLLGSEIGNFHAVLFGDVTGNWVSDPGPSAIGDEERQASAEDQIKAGQLRDIISEGRASSRIGLLSELPGGQLRAGLSFELRETSGERAGGAGRRTFDLIVDEADGIQGLDLLLRYDPSKVRVVDVRTTDVSTAFNLLTHDVDGVLDIALYHMLPMQGSGAALTITIEERSVTGDGLPFKLAAEANERRVPIRVGDAIQAAPR